MKYTTAVSKKNITDDCWNKDLASENENIAEKQSVGTTQGNLRFSSLVGLATQKWRSKSTLAGTACKHSSTRTHRHHIYVKENAL